MKTKQSSSQVQESKSLSEMVDSMKFKTHFFYLFFFSYKIYGLNKDSN